MLDLKHGKLKLLILSVYFVNQLHISNGYETTPEFVIKNMHCGKYVIPSTANNVPDNDPLVMWDDFYTHTRYRFEPVEGIWGYIREVKSNKVWQPLSGGTYSRSEGRHLVLWPTEARWALFAIDQVNNRIIHRDGQYVEYDDGYAPYPPNGDPVELSYNIHQGMNWAFLNPKNISEVIYPYGYPTVIGEWEMIFAVEKPLAKQTWEYVYKLGKSSSRSTSSSSSYEYTEGFEFTWESTRSSSSSITASAGFSAFGFSAGLSTSTSWGSSNTNGGSRSGSSSLGWLITNAAEDTWYGEIQETSTIEVEVGKTVVVWQKVFIGSQLGHRAVFQSNHFGYTDSIKVKPVDEDFVKPDESASAKP